MDGCPTRVLGRPLDDARIVSHKVLKISDNISVQHPSRRVTIVFRPDFPLIYSHSYIFFPVMPGCPHISPIGPGIKLPKPRTMALHEIELHDNKGKTRRNSQEYIHVDGDDNGVEEVFGKRSTFVTSYEQVSVEGVDEENIIITRIPGLPGPPGPAGIVGPKGRRGRKGRHVSND